MSTERRDIFSLRVSKTDNSGFGWGDQGADKSRAINDAVWQVVKDSGLDVGGASRGNPSPFLGGPFETTHVEITARKREHEKEGRDLKPEDIAQLKEGSIAAIKALGLGDLTIEEL